MGQKHRVPVGVLLVSALLTRTALQRGHRLKNCFRNAHMADVFGKLDVIIENVLASRGVQAALFRVIGVAELILEIPFRDVENNNPPGRT
ncbi:hypothetical protein [Glutamicibacter ardleyensis]|uniref:hypothetical protein n=1 Tax=Glutamicibacter ardleyensis TaxID=225894 RepID=UPI003FD60B0E